MPSQPRQSASVTEAAAKTPNAVSSETSQQAISSAGSCESSSAPWRASSVKSSAAHRLVPHETAPPMTQPQGRAWRFVRARRTMSSATCGRYRHISSAIASNANRTGEAPMNFPLRGTGHGSERPGRVSADNTYVDTLRVPVLYRTVGEQLNVFAHQAKGDGETGKCARFRAPRASSSGASGNGASASGGHSGNRPQSPTRRCDGRRIPHLEMHPRCAFPAEDAA